MGKLFPYRVHYIRNQTLWGSRGPALLTSGDCGLTWRVEAIVPCGFRDRSLMRFDLSRRLLRWGVHHVLPLSDHLVVFANRRIFSYQLRKRRWRAGHANLMGSRPLCICATPQGTVYYGEYCGNPQRRPVHVFASDDNGVSWRPVHAFKRVRHIHGVFYDPYEDCLWATTGDEDHEALILKSSDGFQTVDIMHGGSQQARAVQLIFTRDYVYFGSDAPSEPNHLYRLERRTGQVTALQRVGGSVFWGCRVGEWLFFSTAVEPSRVNQGKHAALWASRGGREWTVLARYQRDFLPLRLFQYAQVFLPQGPNDMGRLWYTPFATLTDRKLRSLVLEELK